MRERKREGERERGRKREREREIERGKKREGEKEKRELAHPPTNTLRRSGEPAGKADLETSTDNKPRVIYLI